MRLSDTGNDKHRHVRRVELSQAPLSMASVVAALQSDLRDRRGHKAPVVSHIHAPHVDHGLPEVTNGSSRASPAPAVQVKKRRHFEPHEFHIHAHEGLR